MIEIKKRGGEKEEITIDLLNEKVIEYLNQ